MSKSKELDQWFTKPDVVKLIINNLPVNLKRFDSIVEPCFGNGAFMEYCTEFYDIDPKFDFVITQDFLQLNLKHSESRLFLTNFPYGKAASLSIEMINHASSMGNHIITIVPITMTKYSRQNRINKSLKLLWQMDLPKNSFTIDGTDVDIPSVVQYWSTVGDCLRVSKPISKHKDFNISSRYNPLATFVIRGVRPKITNEIDVYNRISNNTRYYSVEPLTAGVEDIFRSIDLVNGCKSACMPSLSIPECIELYTNHHH